MRAGQSVDEFLLKNPEVPREKFLERLRDERERTGSLVSDEILLRIVASEFGVGFSGARASAPAMPLSSLVGGLADATVVGRVVAAFPPKAFGGKRNGRVASFLVADNSGVLRVVLWNERTNLVGSGGIAVGQIIRFSHCYTKEDRSGKVELHVGARSTVEAMSDSLSADFPTIGRFLTKSTEIGSDPLSLKIHVRGVVTKLFQVSSFERPDSSCGKVVRFTLSDEMGEVGVVAWNEKVDELNGALRRGSRLQIVNARVKKALGGRYEIHVDGGTYVEKLGDEPLFLKVADLKEGFRHVNVLGEATAKPVICDVKTASGERLKLAKLELKDETGKIWLLAWREHAEVAAGFQRGDRVVVKDAYVRKGFGDQPELSTGAASSISFGSR